MRSVSFNAVILTLTSLATSGFALPTLDQSFPTDAATSITHGSHDIRGNPSTIDTDTSTNKQVSIHNQTEEAIPAILLVRSLPFPHNITLPISTCLEVYENLGLNVMASPICPGDEKAYLLLFCTPYCNNFSPLVIESANAFWGNGLWPRIGSGRTAKTLKRWSLMFTCARSKTKALKSLPEPKGYQVLNADRTRTFLAPIINNDEAGLVFNPPPRGIHSPQVFKISASTCLWSPSRELSNKIRVFRPLRCPAGQQSFTFLFTQRECHGKWTLFDGNGIYTTVFDIDENLEEWSILFTCLNHVPEAEGPSRLPHKSSISPSQLVSSSSSSHNFSSILRVVTPPTCPSDRPRSLTVLYAHRFCKGPHQSVTSEKSYPSYKSLFNWAPWIKVWSMGFICIPNGTAISVPRKWEGAGMELIVEGKGWDLVATVVGLEDEFKTERKGIEGTTQTAPLESVSEIGSKGEKTTTQTAQHESASEFLSEQEHEKISTQKPLQQ
ncbi:hypothetical protein NHQ30_003154 [Ciborinia camelliae]|nr:hypothetical protein NHQ30_003154 [Ciborinia camelliae]